MAKFVFDDKTGTLVQESARINKKEIVSPTSNKPDIKAAKLIDDVTIQRPNIQVQESVLQFREKSDLTVFQIIDENTGKVMAYISGYALDISFNLQELKSVEKVEQMIDGIGKMFRKIVLDKIMAQNK